MGGLDTALEPAQSFVAPLPVSFPLISGTPRRTAAFGDVRPKVSVVYISIKPSSLVSLVFRDIHELFRAPHSVLENRPLKFCLCPSAVMA